MSIIEDRFVTRNNRVLMHPLASFDEFCGPDDWWKASHFANAAAQRYPEKPGDSAWDKPAFLRSVCEAIAGFSSHTDAGAVAELIESARSNDAELNRLTSVLADGLAAAYERHGHECQDHLGRGMGFFFELKDAIKCAREGVLEDLQFCRELLILSQLESEPFRIPELFSKEGDQDEVAKLIARNIDRGVEALLAEVVKDEEPSVRLSMILREGWDLACTLRMPEFWEEAEPEKVAK